MFARRPTYRALVLPIFSIFLLVCPAVAANRQTDQESTTVELFSAMEAGQIEVTVIPRNSERLTLQMANQTDRPLTVQVPSAFAAAPVLAQFAPAGGAGPLAGGNLLPGANLFAAGDQSPQILGATLGGMPGNNNFNGLNNAAPFAGGLFNIPPGKTIMKRLDCVCLEFGKPTPNARMPYEVKPLDSFTDRSDVQQLLDVLGQGRVSQRVVQLAAWHRANGVSWEEMAALRITYLNRQTRPRFAPAEVLQARLLVQQLSSSKLSGR